MNLETELAGLHVVRDPYNSIDQKLYTWNLGRMLVIEIEKARAVQNFTIFPCYSVIFIENGKSNATYLKSIYSFLPFLSSCTAYTWVYQICSKLFRDDFSVRSNVLRIQYERFVRRILSSL